MSRKGLFSLWFAGKHRSSVYSAHAGELTIVSPKGLRFHFPPALPALCWKGVLEGKLNAAFIDGPINHTAIDGIPVYREELMIVTPQGHAPVIVPVRLTAQRIYTYPRQLFVSSPLRAGFMLTVPLRELFTRWSRITGMLACVVAGSRHCAYSTLPMLESMPGHHQVEAWPLAEQWRWLTTWLVWRRGAKTRPLEAFIQLLDVPDSAKQGYQ